MKKFLEEHRTRLFFGSLSMMFASLFILIACLGLPVKEGGEIWVGSANTILIGLAMMCYNKARGEKPTDTK